MSFYQRLELWWPEELPVVVLLLANPLHYKAIVDFVERAEGLNSHAFRQANCCEQN